MLYYRRLCQQWPSISETINRPTLCSALWSALHATFWLRDACWLSSYAVIYHVRVLTRRKNPEKRKSRNGGIRRNVPDVAKTVTLSLRTLVTMMLSLPRLNSSTACATDIIAQVIDRTTLAPLVDFTSFHHHHYHHCH